MYRCIDADVQHLERAARNRPNRPLDRRVGTGFAGSSSGWSDLAAPLLKWRDPDSNRGHHDFQSCALPTELSRRANRCYRLPCGRVCKRSPLGAPGLGDERIVGQLESLGDLDVSLKAKLAFGETGVEQAALELTGTQVGELGLGR